MILTPCPYDPKQWGTVATDPDVGENAAISYSLHAAPGAGSMVASQNMFVYDSLTGNLVLRSRIDREKISRISLAVHAKDNGRAKLTGHVTVVLIISDVNDNPPVFEHPSYVFNATSNGLIGHVIGTVSASDADSGADLKFRADLSDKFTIHQTTGSVSVMAQLGSAPPTHTFNVHVTDGRYIHTASVTVRMQPNPKCLSLSCPSQECFGPSTCVGDGLCVLGARSAEACTADCLCPSETAMGCQWRESGCGFVATAPCVNGSVGIATRSCTPGSVWADPDFSGCVREAILKMAANGISKDANLDVLAHDLDTASKAGRQLGAGTRILSDV